MLLSFQHLTPTTISSDPSAVKSQDKHSSRKRRHHQKSRWGCDTCRKRHMKCDEQRPECGQCLYGRRSCAYPASPPTDIPENIAANNVSIQNHDPCISAMLSRISQESHCKNVNLSSLYEHFFQTTNPPWMGSPECQSILQQHAPRFIVGSPFLLHAILAFSAYHVAALTAPGNGYRHHEIVGACHYSLALETYRVAIDDESVDANALFACCMLLTLLSFRNLSNDVGDGDGEGHVPNDAKTLALNTVGIRFIGGPRILAEAFERQAMLDQHLWKPLLHYCGKACGNQDKNDGLVGSPVASRAMADLERLCRGEELEPGGPFDPALTSLRWLMQCYVADKPKMAQFTFCFAIRLDPRFLRFVEEGEPKALLVMCYWYALVRQVDQWWACHTAQTEGMKLLRYLQDTANGDVQGLLDFPAQLLGAS